jgi:hypothetical protein
MGKPTKDTLLKPDMKAVLSRTHLQISLHGFLLPIMEAISNSMHSIEEAFIDRVNAERAGVISVNFKDWTNPNKIFISVSDNGAGLNEDNYKSFRTPFSGHKLSQKGRGFGRFIAFKVFARIVYYSRFSFFGQSDIRSFRFDIHQDEEFTMLVGDPEFDGAGLTVTYNQPLTNWHDLILTLNAEDVANEIGAHFLPYFLYRWLPQIVIQFDNEQPIDIRSRFQTMFTQFASGSIKCDIDGVQEELSYSLAKLPRTKQFRSHAYCYQPQIASSDHRAISPTRLVNPSSPAKTMNVTLLSP